MEGHGPEAWKSKGSKWSPVNQRLQIPITLVWSSIRIRIKVKGWTRIRIEVKSWIRLRMKVMQIRNPDIILGARVEGAAHGAPPGPPHLRGPALLQDGQEVPGAGVRHHSTV